MKFTYQEQEYEVEIVRKNNKNTYIRVKENKICITTNYFTTKKEIQKLLQNNHQWIERMLEKRKEKSQQEKDFRIFGEEYQIIYTKKADSLSIEENRILIKDEKTLTKWLDSILIKTYQEHLKYWYQTFEENIPLPNLKVRKMKTRWGVCNTKNHNVTLNSELIQYDIECLDYVIVHELSHFIEPNHSKNFWAIVSKYCPNYKEIRKKLKN